MTNEFRCGCGRLYVVNVTEVTAFGDHIPGAETLTARKDQKPPTPVADFRTRVPVTCAGRIDYKPCDDDFHKAIFRTRVSLHDLARIIEELANELGKKEIAERAADVQRNIHELILFRG